MGHVMEATLGEPFEQIGARERREGRENPKGNPNSKDNKAGDPDGCAVTCHMISGGL